MRRTVGLTLICLLVVICLPADARAVTAEGNCGNGVTWGFSLYQKTLLIRGNGPMDDYDTGTAPWASYSENIEKIVIGEGVTHIGGSAFEKSACEEVCLPKSLMSIGDWAFMACSEIWRIVYAGDAEQFSKIDMGLFNYALTDAPTLFNALYDATNGVLADPDTTSGECGKQVIQSFDKSTGKLTISGTGKMESYTGGFGIHPPWWELRGSIKSVVIADGVTSIGDAAFHSYDNDYSLLSNIIIPDSVTEIGAYAFWGCSKLASVVIPDSVTIIRSRAFQGSGLTEIEISRSMRYIDNEFSDLENLTSIIIPEGVENLGGEALQDCPNLTKITLPETLKSMGSPGGELFKNCSKLADIYYGGSETQWKRIAMYGRTERLALATVHFGKDASKCPFADVTESDYYYNAVMWADRQNITTGTTSTTFDPNKQCSRAEIITFLWRAAGKPSPNGFETAPDANRMSYYHQAVVWADESNLFTGDRFYPNAPCTREMAMDFMWKYAGSPNAPAAKFNDVDSQAVNWAVNAGITSGTGHLTFSPNQVCTRAQIVTFLYRAFAKEQ